MFYLDSPHLGAPLVRAAGFAGWALGQAGETPPFVTLVNGSSPGIKDLHHGYVLADDRAGCDRDSCMCMRDHRGDTPLLAGANHYTISATITADPAHPLGAVAGDLLVQPGERARSTRRPPAHPLPGELAPTRSSATTADIEHDGSSGRHASLAHPQPHAPRLLPGPGTGDACGPSR